jgi:S-formylglutathione hydrolase FrmB
VNRALLVALAACSSAAPTPVAPQPTTTALLPGPGARGTVHAKKFASAALGVTKRYFVYLPAAYDDRPDVRWPVFYYLHGLTGSESDWVEHGEIDKAADALGLEAIIVMPDGDDSFYVNASAPADYDACMKDGAGLFPTRRGQKRATCVRKRDYETYLVDDLVTHVDATYRTIASREGRAIGGLSMGGYGALVQAMRHYDRFSAAASHSGRVSLLYAGPIPYVAGKVQLLTDPQLVGGPPELKHWMIDLHGPTIESWRAQDPAVLVDMLPPDTLALYVDCGTDDELFLDAQAAYLHERLVALGHEHAYFLGPGRHDFRFWKARVGKSLAFLRDHTAKPR